MILFLYLCLPACKADRDPCLEPRSVNVQLHFATRPDSGSTMIDTALPALNFGAIDGDTLRFLYYAAPNISRIVFPLSDTRDEVKYWLQPDSAVLIVDTITIRYQRQLHFISNACGYNNFYKIESVSATHKLLDSIYLLQSEVTNDVNSTHIEVVY